MRHRWLPPLAAAVSAFVYCLAGLDYPWQLALLTGTAIGALAYSAHGTWTRLRGLYAQPTVHELRWHEEPTADPETSESS